jgi:hypothetical protein
VLTLLTLVTFGALVAGGFALARLASDARADREESQDTDGCDPSPEPEDTRNLCLYPDRDDRQPDDHEARPGDGVRIAGYTATVRSAFVHELVLDDQLGIAVEIRNRDERTQPFGPLDWKIQTRDGSTVTPTQNERDDALGTGELDQGEAVEGTLLFELEPGTYYVLYRPDLFNQARGVWEIEVLADE